MSMNGALNQRVFMIIVFLIIKVPIRKKRTLTTKRNCIVPTLPMGRYIFDDKVNRSLESKSDKHRCIACIEFLLMGVQPETFVHYDCIPSGTRNIVT